MINKVFKFEKHITENYLKTNYKLYILTLTYLCTGIVIEENLL